MAGRLDLRNSTPCVEKSQLGSTFEPPTLFAMVFIKFFKMTTPTPCSVLLITLMDCQSFVSEQGGDVMLEKHGSDAIFEALATTDNQPNRKQSEETDGFLAILGGNSSVTVSDIRYLHTF